MTCYYGALRYEQHLSRELKIYQFIFLKNLPSAQVANSGVVTGTGAIAGAVLATAIGTSAPVILGLAAVGGATGLIASLVMPKKWIDKE